MSQLKVDCNMYAVVGVLQRMFPCHKDVCHTSMGGADAYVDRKDLTR